MKKNDKRRAKKVAEALKGVDLKRERFEQIDDDEGLDEIRIKVVPRFKTSGLSGDGWRVSAQLELVRKGVVVFEGNYSRLHTAAVHLPWLLRILCELDPDDPETGRFTAAGKKRVREGLGALLPTECTQPGCPDEPVTFYRTETHFTRCCQTEEPRNEDGWPEPTLRGFCLRHADRGDCHLSDANRNYDVISGPGPDGAKANPDDESPSAGPFVVDMTGE